MTLHVLLVYRPEADPGDDRPHSESPLNEIEETYLREYKRPSIRIRPARR